MPEPSATSFPTLFTPEDAERLKQLEQQRKELAKAYQVKFSEQAWGRVPPVEKGIRGAIPTQVLPIVGAVTPGIEPTTEFGFTPEQVAKSGAEMEQEYGELARKQKVTRLLPAIQSDLMIAALSGEPIKDLGELMTTFPELKSDFNEEELNYLARVSQALLSASPEQVASGSVFAYEPGQLPLTKEDYDVLKKGRHDPRQVFASVRFARKAEDVAQALRDAFPSTVPEDEALKATRDKLKAYFERRNRELGITPEGTVPTKQAIQDYHAKVAEEVGTAFPLVDNQGNLVVASRKLNNTVWVDKELVGYAQPNGSVVGFNLRGQPLSTPEIKESTIKDLWDVWYLASNQAGIGVEKFLTQILPDAFLALSEKTAPVLLALSSERSREASSNEVKVWRERLKARYEQSSLEFQQWLKDHPELEARADWSKPIESPGDFFNPGRIAYLIASNAPIMASSLAVATGTTVLTGGNIVAGAAAGSAIMIPSMTTDIVDEAITNGAKFEDATSLSTVVGAAMGLVEVAPWMIALRILRPAFMGIFKKNLLKEATGTVVKNLTAKGILGQVAKNTLIITATEELEENIQNIMQNAVIKTFNENRGLLDNALRTTLDTFWAVSPLALMGGAATYRSMKSQLPPQVQQKIDETATKLKDAGLSEEHAEAVALAKVVETETGQAQVRVALEKSVDEVPATSEKIVKLEKEIDSYNKDIERLDQNIKTQLDKLDTMKNPQERQEQEEFIDSFQESLEEIELDKARVLRRLKKARRGLEAKPVEKVTPEVAIPKAEAGMPVGAAKPLVALPSVPEGASTIESVSTKIMGDKRLSLEETQFYNNNMEAIEENLKLRLKSYEEADMSIVPDTEHIPSEETKAILRQIAIQGKIAEKVLMDLIPDLTWRPSEAMPRLPDLDKETRRLEEALNANPDLKALIHVRDEIQFSKEAAKKTLTRLQSELQEAEESENEELIKERTKSLKKIAKDARLDDRKSLLVKGWDALNPPEQSRLALAMIPDHSIDSGIVDDLRDTALVFSSMEGRTDLPLLTSFERIELVRGFSLRLQDKLYRRIANNPRWRSIIRDKVKQNQIALIIDSRREGSTTKVNPPVTEEEHRMVEIADEIASVFKEWEPIVRFQRFMEAYEDSPIYSSIHDKIPDAPEEDIKQAINIMEQEGEDGLWEFLGDKSWGVIGSGYSPWRISKPDLKIDEPHWTAVRGASYLMSRDNTQMPWEAKRGFFNTYDSYNLSMALRYFLRREVQDLADNFSVSYDKWTNPNHVQDYLRKYLRAIQSFPDEDANLFLRIMRKLQSWSHPNIFWHPWVGLRNVLQFVYSHPYRGELIRSLWEYKNLPTLLTRQAAEKFATSVDQSGRPLRQWMFQDEEISVLGEVPIWLKTILHKVGYVTKPLDFLAAQTAKIPTIAVTDKASRSATYKSMLVKAGRATEQYKQDHDAKKWFDNSGINSGYIAREQQAHILGLLALGEQEVSWAIPGLLNVSGYNAATIRVAEETTNRTLYLYDKAIAAGVHRGGGRTLASLFTFPRSTIQMYGMQIARVLSKDSSPMERVAATKNILLLWIVGELLSGFLMDLSGRRRREYSVVNFLTWSFGGLGVGIASDLFDLFSDLMMASGGEEEEKKRALSRLPAEATKLGDVLVGFYKIVWDTAEALSDETKGLDVRYLRKVRAFFDKNYTPEQQEKAERTVIEIVQKILMSAESPDPDALEKAQELLKQEEDRLGELSVLGNYYTIGDFGNKVEAVLKGIPDYLVIEEAGFSELVMFYAHSRDKWWEFYLIPADNEAARRRGFPTRDEWRKSHLEVEAMLLFWDKYGKSVYIQGSKEGTEMLKLRNFWYSRYGIQRSQRKQLVDWTLPGQIPLPEK